MCVCVLCHALECAHVCLVMCMCVCVCVRFGQATWSCNMAACLQRARPVNPPVPLCRFAVQTTILPNRRTAASGPSDVPGTTLVALGGERRSGNIGTSTNELEEYWIEGDAW